ncbi:hypothetical protein PHO31112_00031 [Pandoraea horticolens]|uniref:MarR family transcriptional regulator n=1 Tax=Pandoraea horticolens TaxID=2508298 RepID=A0A5E4RBR3_9BURK|nr:DUF488 family protein [Pandoraea horticolens]VVD59528.1 hypothetical protein PHO31112_00031 [Pandoraea horticolens]
MSSSKATDAAPPTKAGAARKRGVKPPEILFKRVYDAPDPADGQRILADRLWPRGLAKVKAHIDFWAKDVTPSTTLRQWFHQHPEQFDEFRQRFLDELAALDAARNAMLAELRTRLTEGRVTLLTAAHQLEDDEAHTHLRVLQDFLESR